MNVNKWNVCLHWTAGTYDITDFERQFYHFLVDGEGNFKLGHHAIKANIPPLKHGMYAAHCGGGNSWTIGVAICGMHGYRGRKQAGPYPLTRKSFEAACNLIADISREHDIPITKDRVYTHYEFAKKNPTSSSVGKIDISFIPWEPDLQAYKVGDYIREKIKWYLTSEKPPFSIVKLN